MRNIPNILVVLLILGLLINCSNDDDNSSEIEYESTATISGFDLTLCACCGGWIIDIDGEDETKRFDNLPEDSIIDLHNVELPVSVQLNWSESDIYCGRGITIESVELID